MAANRPLHRLHRLLTLKEEQAQAALDVAMTHLRHLEKAFDAAVEREYRGRRLVNTSAHSDQAIDRFAALEEVAAAKRIATSLRPRIVQAAQLAEQRREQYLQNRVERRQAEELIRQAEMREASEASRRSQQATDDWYLRRLRCAAEQNNPDSNPETCQQEALE